MITLMMRNPILSYVIHVNLKPSNWSEKIGPKPSRKVWTMSSACGKKHQFNMQIPQTRADQGLPSSETIYNIVNEG